MGIPITKDGAVSRAIVEVADLGYTFTGRDAPSLEDVSFSLEPGTWTLIAGATGSGKSTLLRALVGLIPNLARGAMLGRVTVGGVDTRLQRPAQLAQSIGFIAQSPDDQLCAATVEAELAFGLENLNLPVEEISHRIASVAADFGLTEMLSRPSSQLSGGMKQRLVLAAVTAMQPKVLICDEPLSQLDAVAARDFLDHLDALRRSGLTIVMAEHRLAEVRPYANRELTLDRGRLVDDRPATSQPPPAPQPPRFAAPPSSATPALSLQGLEFRFRGAANPVWSDVSATFRRGERVAIVGANGSGKSTLLGVLAGLLRPTAGRFEIAGDLARLPVSLVPQRADLTLFHRTVRAELAYGPRLAGLNPATIAERVDLTARMFRLDAVLDEHPQSLSQGGRVRAAVAAALAAAPRLLLLDEPTTGQDLPTMRAIMELLVTCIGTPGGPEALLFSTHDLETAARYADRALILADGRLAADVPASRLLDDEALLRSAGLQARQSRRPG